MPEPTAPPVAPAPATAGMRLRRAAPLLLGGAAAIALAATLGHLMGRPIQQFAHWVEGLGAWGPLAFVLGYALATVAFAPGALLTLAAGALFGIWAGTLYSLTGATLGACLAFLIARYLARGAVERRIAGNPRFQAIDRAVGEEGFKIVALLRLSPVFPFNLLNYALGLTRVPFLAYLAASAAMLPGTFLYVSYGSAARALSSAFVAGHPSRGPASWILLSLGLLATLLVTILITRLAARALRQQIDRPSPGGRVAG